MDARTLFSLPTRAPLPGDLWMDDAGPYAVGPNPGPPAPSGALARRRLWDVDGWCDGGALYSADPDAAYDADPIYEGMAGDLYLGSALDTPLPLPAALADGDLLWDPNDPEAVYAVLPTGPVRVRLGKRAAPAPVPPSAFLIGRMGPPAVAPAPAPTPPSPAPTPPSPAPTPPSPVAEALAALHNHPKATGDSRQAVHNAAYAWAITNDIPEAIRALALVDLLNPALAEAAQRARAALWSLK